MGVMLNMVKFCHICKSENVFPFGLSWKCGNCGETSIAFPEKEVEKKDNKEKIEKGKEK